MSIFQKILAYLVALFSTASFANSSIVYFNGDILTMQGERPEYVEALVIQHDKIMYAGNKSQALIEAGPQPMMHDLHGQTLMPGFIDSWGHFALIAQNTLGVNLGYFSNNPPQTKEQAIKKLLSEGKPFNGWILSSGY
jgi:predicted amidohydrolase YtcJ